MSTSALVSALRCAAALALASVGAGVFAQAPLVPINPALVHRHLRAAPPRDFAPTIVSGRSYVSPPRSGRPPSGDAFAPIFGANATQAGPPWTSVGPSVVDNAGGTVGGNLDAVSGRVAAIAVDPNTDTTFYVASAGGGVWKTTDGGQSYVATTDLLGDTAMGSVAVAPSNGQVVYAGTGEANGSGDSRYGIGLLKSTDGASTWSLIPGPSNAFYRKSLSKIVVSPTDPSTVYLTTANGNYGVGGNGGVWKSTDGGATWANVTAAAGLDSGQSFRDLVLDPTTPTTLYAAGASSLYKTTDGGATWAILGGGLPTANIGRTALALCASAPGTLYASITNSSNSSLLGLYKTTDGGNTWAKLTGVPNYLGQQGWYDNAVAVSPTNPNQVFMGGQVNYNGTVGTYYALVGSQDGGSTFQDYSLGTDGTGPHTDLHALTFAADGSVLLDGNDGGVWRLENPSTAGGNTTTEWTDLNTTLGTIQFTGIALHPTDPTVAYGGSQDNGTEKYTGSTAWTQVRDGDGGFVRVDQSNPQTVYHEYYGISLERSDDGGATWNGKVTGINPSDPQPPDGSDPAAFYVPFKLDPLNQSRVIYATDHVYESTNRGDSFTAIGTPGTAGYNAGDSIVSTLGVAGGTIYAAAGGHLFVTTNDGAAWADVSLPGGLGSITDISVNPSNASEAYVSRATFAAGKIFHTTNGGTTWTDVSGNLPNEPFNAVAFSPATGNLYAGGDDGVYLSANGGASWSRFDPTGDFPTVQVVDLAISPGANLIGAGTHGRGLFEMVLPSTAATVLAVASVTTAYYQTVTLTATLTVGGVGVAGKTVTFKAGGATVGTGVTNASGVATKSYPVAGALAPGPHTLAASFAGDSSYAASSGAGTLTVTKVNATLTVASVSGAVGQTVTLSVTLKRSSDGALMANRTLTFLVDGASVGTAITNASGVATLSYAIPSGTAVGSHTITVTFPSEANYNASSGAGTLTVGQTAVTPTTLAVASVTTAYYQTVTLTATLTAGGAGVSGKTVTFTAGGTTVGTAVTNSSGVATRSYPVAGGLAPGSHTLSASFAGDSSYAASTGTGTLTVTKVNATLTVAPVTGTRGTTVTLSVTLKRSSDGALMANRMLTFLVDGASVGTAITNASGVATLSYLIPSGDATGAHAVTVTFPAEANYNASSGAGTLTVN